MKKNLFIIVTFIGVAMLLSGCSKSKSSSSDYESDNDTAFTSVSFNGYSGSSEDSSYGSTDYSGSSSEESSSSSSSDNEDWDSVLSSYEDFANKYIALLKKAQKGDVSALSEYQQYMEEAQELTNKISSAKSDLSSSQLAKFNKIQQKILKAASSIKINTSKLDAIEKAADISSPSNEEEDEW